MHAAGSGSIFITLDEINHCELKESQVKPKVQNNDKLPDIATFFLSLCMVLYIIHES